MPEGSGQSAITSDSPPVSAFHSASVTNGITGCSSLQQCIEHRGQHGGGVRDSLGELDLGQLDVPVTELVPGEVIQRLAAPG